MKNVRVDGTEVALHSADLLFKDLVPKPCLELALPERGGGDTHRVLSTTEEDLKGARWVLSVQDEKAVNRERAYVRFCWGNRGAVQGRFCLVSLEDHQRPGIM